MKSAAALILLSLAQAAAGQRFEAGETFVREMEQAARLPDRNIKVIFDPTAKSCGWASSSGGANVIALEPRCMDSHDADYRASVLAHELAHVHRGHAFTPGGATKRQQLEADELGGFAIGMLGGSERQALAHPVTTSVDNGVDPPRAERIAAAQHGWQLAQAILQDEKFWTPESAKGGGPSPPGKTTFFGMDSHSFLCGLVIGMLTAMFLGRGR